MKFSTAAFVFTLVTGALAAPQVGVNPDSEKRDIAARDVQGSSAYALDVRHVEATTTLDERDVPGAPDAEEDDEDELEARAPKKKGKGKGKKKAKKAGKGKGKKKAAKGKKAGKAKAAKAAKVAEAKPRVTSSFDAPGVV